jgi:hypothetical protein
MRNHTKVQILAALALALFAMPASDLMAQRRRGLVDVSPRSDRHGFWLTLGAGAGGENYRFSDVPGWGRSSDLYKPDFWLALGGTVSPNFRLGGEINGWVNYYTDSTGVGVTESLVGGLLIGQFYPMQNQGLFFKGGAGISRSGTSTNDYGGYGGTSTGETGFAYELGAGYELRLGRNLFLTPTVNYLEHRSSPGGPTGDNLGTLRERVLTFGVGLTLQPGRH